MYLPTPYTQNSAYADEFDFLFALTNEECHVKQNTVEAFFIVKEPLREIFGELIVVFELVSHGIQQRAGRSHVADGTPGSSPEKEKRNIFSKSGH